MEKAIDPFNQCDNNPSGSVIEIIHNLSTLNVNVPTTKTFPTNHVYDEDVNEYVNEDANEYFNENFNLILLKELYMSLIL